MYAKTNQHCRAEDCLASIWNDLPQEFTDKAILLIRKRLRFCVAAASGHFEHSVRIEKGQLTFTTEAFESVDEKVVQSLIRY